MVPATGLSRAHLLEAWVEAGLPVEAGRGYHQIFHLAVSGVICLGPMRETKGGATEQSKFRDYKLVRMAEAPRAIHVDIIQSDAPPGGVGEPGVPPVAPAIANALFALTGTRVRDLPIVRTVPV